MTPAEHHFLEEAKKITHTHLTDPEFSVALFAKAMQLSRSQLHRKLKRVAQCSASEFIRAYRLQQAIHLMKQGVNPIRVIAKQVGFNSESYFRKCFKDVYTLTPKDYMSKTLNFIDSENFVTKFEDIRKNK
ncbi:helix-turn-helix transcriptional regulator [bacterium]|nr:helix-turn-helix transcriptional regulator [bacterium]